MNPEQIRIIQERLSALGYRVPITGLMDEATMQAVAAYNTIQRPREAGAFSARNYPQGDFTLQSGEGFAPRGQTPTLGGPSPGLAPFLGPPERYSVGSPASSGAAPTIAEGFAPRSEAPPSQPRTRQIVPVNDQPAPEPAPAAPPTVARRTPTSFPGHPMPSSRPVELARSVLASSESSGPSSRELWERLNVTDSPADFVRADRAMLAGRAAGGRAPSGAGGKHDAIAKALEIIHHLIMRGR